MIPQRAKRTSSGTKPMKGKIYIGTSGWHYKHWVGTFYPKNTKDSQQLSHYLRFFKTVELNNSFYRLPSAETFKTWRRAVPKDFIFSVKGSRFISHMKKLKVERHSIQIFFDSVKNLREKTGPILFQLPPKWKINVERLHDFLRIIPKKYRYAFEFRNNSWYDEKIYAVLRKFNAAFCVYELEHHLSPIITTANFVYVRLHGPDGKYAGSYSDSQLKNWVRRCRQWQEDGKDVFVYFDNDQLGYAAWNAITLQRIIMKKRRSANKKP